MEKIVVVPDIKFEEHVFFIGQRCKDRKKSSEWKIGGIPNRLNYEQKGNEQTIRNLVEALQSDEESVSVMPFDHEDKALIDYAIDKGNVANR